MLISDFLDATVGMDETFILTQKNDEQLVFSGEIIEITSKKIIIGPAQHEIHLGTLIYKLKKSPANLQLYIQKVEPSLVTPLFGFKLEPSTLIFTT